MFIAGILLGIALHSSWEAQRGRNSSSGGGFTWRERTDKGKGADHTKVIHPSM